MNPRKLAAFAIIGLLAGAWLVGTCEKMQPIVIPDYQGQRDSIAAAYRRDAAFWHRRHIADSTHADSGWKVAGQLQRRSLAVRPTRRGCATKTDSLCGTPGVGTIPPDSGMANNVAINPDSVSDNAHLRAVNDSLWTALDLADSAYSNLAQAYSEQVQATADAMAGWRAADSSLVSERKLAKTAITDLTARLRKAQRGCRVLGLLPCPELVGGYGAVATGGGVAHGPGALIGVKIAF